MDSSSDQPRDPTEVLGELVDSFLERCRSGEKLSVDEYVKRFPEHSERLREILDAVDFVEELRDGPAEGGDDPSSQELPPLRKLGDYRLLREIGRGGMGIVYEAEQVSLGRHVALKVLPYPAMNDPTRLERFQREARAAASLHHSNIVPVFGVGEDDGVHYFAMQFIRGHPLDEVLEDVKHMREESRQGNDKPTSPSRPPSQAACSLVAGLLGSEHAEKDPDQESTSGKPEKPSEAASGDALVSGSPPSTAVLSPDFVSRSGFHAEYFRNVARVAAQAADGLAYAHGEGILHRDIKPSNLLLDARGNVWVTDFGLAKAEDSEHLTLTGDVLGTVPYMAPERFRGWADPRSDVYSLGITLYELATLQPAFSDGDRARLIRKVAQDEPPRPRKLDLHVPRDLETIVLRAIDKEPGRRYQNAGDLAGDLRRFVAGEPIRARRTSRVERLVKWARRRPAVAALVVVALVAVVSFLLGGIWYSALQSALKDVRSKRYTLEMRLAQEAWEAGNVTQVVDFLESYIPERGEDDLPHFEWYYLWNLSHQSRRTLSGVRGQLFCVTYSGDGRWLASGGSKGRIKIWDTHSGEERTTLPFDETVLSVAFSPDSRFLASGSVDKIVRVWDVDTGELVEVLEGHVLRVQALAFSADGETLASSGGYWRVPNRGELILWDVAPWKQRRTLAYPCQVSSVALSPTDGVLAVATQRGAEILDAQSGMLLRRVNEPCRHVAFSPDGKTLATSSLTRAIVRFWDLASGEQTWEFVSPAGMVGSCPLAFSPHAGTFAAGGGKVIYVWSEEGGGPPRKLEEHSAFIQSLAFSPDGRTLASAADDGTVKEWEISEDPPLSELPAAGVVDRLSFSPGGELLAVSNRAGTVDLWNMVKQRLQATLEVDPAGLEFLRVAFSPDGTRLASGSGRTGVSGEVKLWDVKTAKLDRALGGLEGGVACVAFSPHGLLAAAGGRLNRPGELKVWSEAGDLEVAVERLESRASSVAFSPDGVSLALGTDNGSLALRDTHTWRVRVVLEGHRSAVRDLAFSPDSALLATASFDGTVRVWDTANGRLKRSLSAHNYQVWSVTFSPDGTRLVTGGGRVDPAARVWETTDWLELLVLEGHTDSVTALAFSPDGEILATGSGDRTVRLWRGPRW